MRVRLKKDQAELVLTAIGIYNAVNAGVQQYLSWRTERGYTISIPSSDDAFAPVSRAVLKLVPENRRHKVRALSERRPDGTEVHGLLEATKPETVTIEGHRVRVGVERETAQKGGAGNVHDLLAAMMETERLVLWSSTKAGREAAMRFVCHAVAEAERQRTGPRLWMATKWGDWSCLNETPARPLETVVLPDGQREELVHDMTTFLDREAEYVRLGLPWHRGYLLHGPPGTGKTSIVKAIASHFGLDLYCIPLADLNADAELPRLLGQIDSRSALLLEDIDTATAARDRDAETKGLSTSGLLNALDGVATPHGLITFMTTNRREAIDPALIRPGRCDRHFQLGLLDDDQLSRLTRAMIGFAPDLPPIKGDLAPAVVIEMLKGHIDDPRGFVNSLRDLLEEGAYVEQQG